eukprot:TRINITY_DN87425_c0_g1_i1.p2 TRINITY_DN87425_c0_g1~~TRINITY_DN87425_c0_g1_i1.p2  ORF type:complete len:289 (-),score=71.28 TRINITY_DN87425_c0_g1_i1:77-943(-)
MSQVPDALQPTEEDIRMLLAANSHLGTRNLDPMMESYIWKRRVDGFYIMDLRKTWEKLVLAARVIVAIENPADVMSISARPWGQRAVMKFAKYTGTKAISGRFTPGTFTNYITKQFNEPRLLILTDPRTDHQPIRESSYVNVPTIAFCHTDSPTRHVDIVIPANNKGKHSIGLLYWLLARTVLRLRDPAHFPRSKPWNVMVDLFFYRDLDEASKDKEKEEDGDDSETEESAVVPVSATKEHWKNPSEWTSEKGETWKPASWAAASEGAAAPTEGGAGWGRTGWDESKP